MTNMFSKSPQTAWQDNPCTLETWLSHLHLCPCHWKTVQRSGFHSKKARKREKKCNSWSIHNCLDERYCEYFFAYDVKLLVEHVRKLFFGHCSFRPFFCSMFVKATLQEQHGFIDWQLFLICHGAWNANTQVKMGCSKDVKLKEKHVFTYLCWRKTCEKSKKSK